MSDETQFLTTFIGDWTVWLEEGGRAVAEYEEVQYFFDSYEAAVKFAEMN